MQTNVNLDTMNTEPVQQIAVLELTVNNHPGVMSHICGLFSRRAYNVEGIVCLPVEGTTTSKMWLQVNEETKLEQIIKQVNKLADVICLTRHDEGHKVFAGVAALV